MFLLVCMSGSLVGCSKQPQITSYTVKRESAPVATSTSREPSDRMLGAIVPQADRYWFFKLTGPKTTVAGVVDGFEQFVKSLTFTAGPGASQPKWTLPSGWTQKPGNEFRFATIEIAAEPKPLELTVSPLPRDPTEDDAPAVLANVNRWRGQLELKPFTADELAKETRQLEVAGLKVTLTDFTGVMSSGGMGPMAGMNAGAAPQGPKQGPVVPAAPPGGEPAEPLPFAFVKPANWQDAPATGLRKLSFTLNGGSPEGKKNEVTVIDLDGGLASELLPNVNRWRGQVGLGDTTAETLAKEAKKLTLGSAQGDYVVLAGAERTILGVIVRAGDRGWFFKLDADRATAEKEQGSFEAFMQSVKFK